MKQNGIGFGQQDGFEVPGRSPVIACNFIVAHAQGSEVPSLGTFSGTLCGKWAKVGKMGGNGGK